jgi:APA family basic amino acid/polyamine antiporter
MIKDRLFARKSLETLLAEMKGENRLRRVLGPVALTCLGIGAIIGSGIFVMTGESAAVDAGPAVMVSFVVAGFGCALAALCYAEFASLAPVAGSAYTYAYATLGELLAWIIGWDLILEYAMSGAVVASGWSNYFNSLVQVLGGWPIDERFLSDPFTYHEKYGSYAAMNVPAVFIMLVITMVLVIGIRESATTNTIMVAVKIAVVLFVIVVGWGYINSSYWTDLPASRRLPPGEPEEKWGLLSLIGLNEWLVPIDDRTRTNFMPYGISGLMLGAAIVFFAYIGFDSISTHSEEARRPQRDVPIGILASLGICTLLYILVAAIITGMEPYYEIDTKAAVSEAFRRQGLREDSWLLRASAGLIALGALAGMTSVLLVTFLSQARIFLAMARDGLLPRGVFGSIHERFRTPHLSTMITGGIVAGITAVTPIKDLELMVNIGTLLAFVVVCAAVLLLRIRQPEAHRPFRCPAVYVVAPLGIIVNLGLTLFLPLSTWLRLVVWLAIGLVIYFSYGYSHSLLGRRLTPALAGGPGLDGAPADAGRTEDVLREPSPGAGP